MSNKNFYKTVDLFGNETTHFIERKTKFKGSLLDYEGFVDKFEAKKTTDDCYTPPKVYQAVLNYVNKKTNLENKNIIRPFFPDGDYESIEYKENDVVIDNPPFSIISKIARYYINHNVPFFLFAPHLTLFSSDINCTHIVVGEDITYENGAKVKTSFLSNMFGNIKVIGDHELYETLKEIDKKNRVELPKYKYPHEVLTVSEVQWMVERGVSIELKKEQVYHYRGLESQKPHKKAIFGSGFLMSDKATEYKIECRNEAVRNEAVRDDNTIIWELSDKEREIIKSLQ